MWEYGFARLSPVSGRRRAKHVWCGENQSSTACHPSACLAARTRTSTQPAPAMVMIAASVAIAVVSDPVEARPLFVTPAACFLACSAFCFLASASFLAWSAFFWASCCFLASSSAFFWSSQNPGACVLNCSSST